MNATTPFVLGDWQVYPDDGRIVQGKTERRLQPRVMQVLCRLAANAGEVVPRDALLADVWDGRAISDEPLNRCIAELRAALGDNCQAPRYIETLPRRGYRLVAPVTPEEHSPRPTRGVAAYLLVLLGVVTSALLTWQAPAQEVPRLLVLPLQSLSSDPENRLLADGLTEELINALSRLDLVVLSRETTFAFRDTANIERFHEAVRADHFVRGSVRIVDDRLRVTIQLVDARTGTHLMSEVFSQPLSIASATLDDIAVAISRRTDRALAPGRRSGLPPGTTFAVYRKFIEARHLWQSDRVEEIRRSIVMLEDVAREVPAAVVHANLAAAYDALKNRDEAQGHYEDKINSHLETALALEPDQPLANALVGVLLDHEDTLRAFRLLEKALENDPALARAKLWKMQILYRAGYLEDANQLARELHELDPLSGEMAGWLANLELLDINLASFHELVARSEALGWRYSDTLLFYSALRTQDRDAASLHLKRRWAHSTRVTERELELIVDAIFDIEKRDEAIALVHDMLSRQRPITRFWGFVWLDLLGAHDQAIDLMTRERRPRDVRVLYSVWESAHAELRKHPRFHELATHFGLPDLWKALGPNRFCSGEAETLRCN